MNSRLKLVETQRPTKPFCGIFLCAEAPGETEALEGVPLIGGSGRLLNSLLKIVGIDREACYVGNVFRTRPPHNKVEWFFKRKGVVKEEWAHEVERIRAEIIEAKPNIVLALGATAMWALTGFDKISKYRGTVIPAQIGDKVLKVLPTYHPAYVLRNYSAKPTVGKDILKCKIESQTSEIKWPERELWLRPTLEDLAAFEEKYMPGELLSVDIETDPWLTNQVLCIGFAPSLMEAIVVPLMDRSTKGWSYWKTLKEEEQAINWCRKWLEDASIPKLGQNFMYDMQWLDKMLGIKVRGAIEDTMFMHHALQPELEKSLGYLSSVYTNESAFKTLVNFKSNKEGV